MLCLASLDKYWFQFDMNLRVISSWLHKLATSVCLEGGLRRNSMHLVFCYILW